MTTATDDVVIDSSVIIAIVTPEEHTKWARRIIAKPLYFHTLDLSYYEVANALRYKAADNLPQKNAQLAWSKAKDLISIFKHHNYSETINEVFSAAKELNIAVYDAAFVSLADKLGYPLLTVDIKLVKKLEGTRYYKLVEFPGEAPARKDKNEM